MEDRTEWGKGWIEGEQMETVTVVNFSENFDFKMEGKRRWLMKVLWGYLRLYLYESESRSVVSDSLWPHGLYSSWNSPGQNTGVGSLSIPQGIFPTQGSNPGFSHCRWILYQLSHKGSPRILEWSILHSQKENPLLQGIFLTQELNQGLLCCR